MTVPTAELGAIVIAGIANVWIWGPAPPTHVHVACTDVTPKRKMTQA